MPRNAIRLLTLKEIVGLLSGTDLELVRLFQGGRMSGMNYRLQVRTTPGPAQGGRPSGGVETWADYRTMEEMHHCPVFRWAMEEAREAMHPHDPRMFLVVEFLAEPAFRVRYPSGE